MQRNANRSLSIALYKTQVQMDQRLQHKSSTLNLKEEKAENSLEHIGIGDNFLNRIPVAQTLRSTINGAFRGGAMPFWGGAAFVGLFQGQSLD